MTYWRTQKTLKPIITSMLLVLTGATLISGPRVCRRTGKSGEAKESAGGSKGKAKGKGNRQRGSAAVDSSGAGSGFGCRCRLRRVRNRLKREVKGSGTKFSLKSEKDRVANLNSQLVAEFSEAQ